MYPAKLYFMSDINSSFTSIFVIFHVNKNLMKFQHGSLELASNALSEVEIEIIAQYSMQITG